MSILIKTPFRKRFGDCFDNPPMCDIVRYEWFTGTARLFLRLMIGERKKIFGCGSIRLFGFTWAAWAWVPERP